MLDILYQDDCLVVINKPNGLLVHRSMIDRHERTFAMQMTRDQIGQHVYPVHRLDRATSGILLFALDSDTARIMSEQFTDRSIDKQYLALVRGYTDEIGEIDHPLREEHDKISDQNASKDKEAQAATTNYQTLEKRELPYAVGRYKTARYSLVALHPSTGRKHQLRRHMKHIFHPIVGDTTHGDGKQNTFVRGQFDCHRLMLHASGLQFNHPCKKQSINIQAPMPDNMTEPLFKMGFESLGSLNS